MWFVVALAFAAGLHHLERARAGADAARQLALEFLAGYLVEQSLSIDNMFVFALVFRHFAVPARLQHRVLFYGVVGAIVARGVFVALGTALVRLHWIMVGFGLFLVYTGIRLAFEHRESIRPGDGLAVRLARRILPVTPSLRGDRFLVRVDGVLHATPLLVVLIVLETTDVVFAIDSVPAVFAVTRDPVVVYASNVLAVLGLRSLYFLLADAMHRFRALKYGLAIILVFVGAKMAWLDAAWGGRFPVGVSLAVIAAVLVVSVLLSLALPGARAAIPARGGALGEQRSSGARAGRGPTVAPREARAVGAMCLLLAAAGAVLLVARWSGRIPAGAEHLGAVALGVSSACWLAIGVSLLRAGLPAGTRTRRKVRTNSPSVKTER